MKNIIKKATTFAMAFTLLGAGTNIVRVVSPKSDTAITASADGYRVKRHKHNGITARAIMRYSPRYTNYGVKRNCSFYCARCGRLLNSYCEDVEWKEIYRAIRVTV